MIRDLLKEVVEAGYIGDDITPDELAAYCFHALRAASSLRSDSAARGLVSVSLAGLRPGVLILLPG